MGMIDDIMKALDRWEEWRLMRSLPVEFARLERRVAELEEKLGGKWPADVCRFCGERGMRLTRVFGPDMKGNMRESWNCEKCRGHDERVRKPS